ncbi:hypothetical protein FACS1894184_04370 [Clostridia bacterium]|nr:hypothetical protein FACS1894184_04370 [Clostridia bacterium]
MTHRERFNRVFTFQPVDRVPCYFFGSWAETRVRWGNEGFDGYLLPSGDYGPQLPGMDPDWEPGLWNWHGIVNIGPMSDQPWKILEKRDDGTMIVRSGLGKVEQCRIEGASIPHTLEFPLEPTRESWDKFKRFFEYKLDARYNPGWEQIIAKRNEEDIVTPLLGGSFYGWIRDYMGVENLSYIQYDDPLLLEEMIETITEHMILLTKPLLQTLKVDFVYFFEDCCGSSGPLFSPPVYREVFDKYYKRLIRFYKDNGVPLVLVDSDGWSELLMPCWLESGFDIMFPIEVGKWGAHPADLRRKFGDSLRMFGGLDKRLIYGDEATLRAHLESLKPEVMKGGYIPIPDHRIPPETSYEQMLRYIHLYHEIFNG